jgi:GAF domain-containing protein
VAFDDAKAPRSLPALRWVELLRTIERIGKAESEQEIIETVRVKTRAIADADGVALVLREGDLCHYAVEDGISPLWAGRRFPMSACISGWCMQHESSAVIPNIYEDSRIPAEAYRPTFVAALVMVPVGKPATAAIGAYWARPHHPGLEVVLQLEELAKVVAAALGRTTCHSALSADLAPEKA